MQKPTLVVAAALAAASLALLPGNPAAAQIAVTRVMCEETPNSDDNDVLVLVPEGARGSESFLLYGLGALSALAELFHHGSGGSHGSLTSETGERIPPPTWTPITGPTSPPGNDSPGSGITGVDPTGNPGSPNDGPVTSSGDPPAGPTVPGQPDGPVTVVPEPGISAIVPACLVSFAGVAVIRMRRRNSAKRLLDH